MDGVLINSEETWDQVRRGLASEAGCDWPPDATTAMQGMSTPEWAHYLTTTVGIPGSDSDVATTAIDAMAAHYARHVPLIDGAVAAVAELARHWPLGLASSSPPSLINSVLAASGMTEYFQVAISSEEVEAGKPSPAVYLAVTSSMGVNPAKAIAIEDSSNGLRSAAAAGMVVIAVPQDNFPPAPDALTLASATVAQISDITAQFIRSLVH